MPRGRLWRAARRGALEHRDLDCDLAKIVLSCQNKRGGARVSSGVIIEEKLMKRFVAVALALTCGITAVLADTDPIAEAASAHEARRRSREDAVRHV